MSGALIIVSGGQSGVDRGALDAALDCGTPCAGWCPEGRTAEDGVIPGRYPLSELPGAGPPERTRRNVADSDGTLILLQGALHGGTAYTHATCVELGKPVLLVDAAVTRTADAAARALEFVAAHGIRRLNVAGPRASHWNGARTYAYAVVHALIGLAMRHEAHR
ncbi:MAG: hypothetical protein EHM60_04590 [Lysobacterales bacterium]|nr:MAG: hypothetical protein EHM60_04590 [Xanthomonadales bacterium]